MMIHPCMELHRLTLSPGTETTGHASPMRNDGMSQSMGPKLVRTFGIAAILAGPVGVLAQPPSVNAAALDGLQGADFQIAKTADFETAIEPPDQVKLHTR